MPQHSRLSTLDGLRGLAAILVMLFHAGWRSPVPMPGGYLAVDLFFGLSGIVLTRAYQDRFRAGLTITEFLVARIIRVAPMAIIGGTIGVLLWGGRPETILLVPDFTSDQNLFPTNPPLWSLLLELIVNALWALVALRIGWSGILLVLAISGGLLAQGIWIRGEAMDLGSFWFTLIPGIARTVFSFTVGVALFRLVDERRIQPRPSRMAWFLFPALVILLGMGPAQRGVWDLFCIFLALPAVLWLGIRWDLPTPPIGAFLGDLSYPLYCIHVPIVALCHDAGLGMAYVMALLVVAASALNRWIDIPVRRLLSMVVQRQPARLSV